ncbi:tetratricopeptide repeat protein [Mucilaginibacter sp. AW1-3]
MKKGSAILILLFQLTVVGSFAQDKKPARAINKPLTGADSNMVRQMFFAALCEKTSERYPEAAELFTHVLQVDPLNDASLYELGRIKRLQKDETTARGLFEKATALQPDNQYYWMALAESYEKINDIPKLENVFDELVRIDPNNPQYLFDKANTLYTEKKYDQALDVYKRLEELTGLNDGLIINRQKIYLKQGKIDQATGELEEMIKVHPEQMRYYLLLAELYNSNNMNDKAQSVLLRAEKINPNNELVHLALADIYSDKKDYKTSYDQIKRAFALPDGDIDQKLHIISGYLPKFPDPNAKASALELSKILTVTYPNNSKAYAAYGDMLQQNDSYKEAQEAYKKSISLNNQVYGVWEQLIRVDLTNNDIDAAIKDGEESLSIFPNQAWMNYLVGVAWAQKKDYNKALSYASNVPSLETQDNGLLSQTYSVMGDCYHSMKEYKKSDEAYSKSIEYNPDNMYTLNNFAYYLSLRGEQLDKAAQMAKHANELQPGSSSFQDTYAWVLFKQKKYTEAKEWIEKAIASDKGKDATQIEHYGDILFYLNDTDGAVQNWKKAKQLGAQSPALDRKINEKKYIE